MDCTALDHSPPPPGDPRAFREQFGPGREARALAIVHIAMFDVVNAAAGNWFRSYTGLPAVQRPTELNVAIAQAAHDTLVRLWPAQKASTDSLVAEDLAEFADGDQKTRGIALGRRAAASILARRANDGSAQADPLIGVDYIPGTGSGEWRQDPISLVPIALGAKWGQVRPFVLRSADQFRISPPPALTSARYTRAFNEELPRPLRRQACESAGGGAHAPHATHPTLLDDAVPTLTESNPLARQASKSAVACPQPGWISPPAPGPPPGSAAASPAPAGSGPDGPGCA